MGSFKINGGKELSGTVQPQGAKNEALQIICATLLTKDKITIQNIPIISDVICLIELLKGLGVTIEKIKRNTYTFEANNIDLNYLQDSNFRKNSQKIRGSVMILGPLIARFGFARLYPPGGDKIGRRRLDTHLIGLTHLGAKFKLINNKYYKVEGAKLKGKYILLDEASVTGTANIIMAAVLAYGETIIYNAACEPYIQQLCKMLNLMGASIKGVGSNLLTIKGVRKLKGCKHRILPDMVEIGSWIGLAAMTQSKIRIKNVSIKNLGTTLNVFKKMGINLKVEKDDIIVKKQKKYNIDTFINGSILTISDAPWPGFTPDLLSIIIVTATQANGSILVHQKMFESRLFFVDKLIEMGAKIILCDPHRATITGINRQYSLKATTMTSPDIRAGIALLIAALSAKGTSVIHNIEQIDRGYEKIDERLKQLGASIVRTE
ncbi:MAG: UDP-N-acetylglucosamine 1-carboxyvinyltransferase [Flavobacteriales bacterium]|jgi:UDP-N-acetylglucosamine 1-carboxyvinyltransferase|nr:UDP-N-acetylglucosamine 1-carboxyvinyltransferase [Flavobacteriales bacterium]|tara:strand:+ start:20703 stop:22007 length:1305 start_codon:yes stop_codon:yes gene_type:complete